MIWNEVTNTGQLIQIDAESMHKKVFILKHSTRCSISTAALNRIERKWKDSDNALVKPYYLDLIAYRTISNEIAEKYQVEHESPQLLLIENGNCVSVESHFDITYEALMSKVAV